MDRTQLPSYEYFQQQTSSQGISPAGTVLYGLVVIYIVHNILVYFDYPILPPQELLWNAVVYVIPKYLLLDSARRQELRTNNMLSQTHAAKSEALRRVLGMGGGAMMESMPAGGIMRRASTNLFARPKVTSDVPPGLGNWDNSCYQNSVLQGLASLDTLKPYLERTTGSTEKEVSTSRSLLETVGKLKGAAHNGKQLWTPAKLKNMSSWQQQDAQEYFSKIMDELDKEAAKVLSADTTKPGLETVAEEQAADEESEQTAHDQAKRNPMEGMLAQKVACTRCGFSEGLSMIPFNCLTVPLGSDSAYDLDECLAEYTKLEEISDVECAKCTLLRAEKQLTAMLPPPPSSELLKERENPEVDSKVLALPPELRAQAFKRLAAIQNALEGDDFEDKTIAEKCEIGKKARVSSTKTRQAVIARAPQSLVVHVNRSVFDEMTGAQRKNYASVRWPEELDLGAWMLRAGDDGHPGVASLLSEDDAGATGANYRIKAAVTHYGRHENGHYICYRRHPVHIRDQATAEEGWVSGEEATAEQEPQKQLEERWWRLSDEDVSSVSEHEVLAQGGVFMLFYERIQDSQASAPDGNITTTIPEAPAAPLDDAVATGTQHDDPKRSSAVDETSSALQEEDVQKVSTAIDCLPDASAVDSASAVSTPTTALTEPDSEADDHHHSPKQSAEGVQKLTTPSFMRTAHEGQTSGGETGFGGIGIRPMAAT